MATRLFTLLKQRDIDACIERAGNAVREWGSAWHPASAIEIDCCAAADPSIAQPNGQWTICSLSPGAALWCYRPVDFNKQMEHLLFELGDALRSADRHRESKLAGDVTNDAIDDLIELLLTRLIEPAKNQRKFDAQSATQPPQWQFLRHSGAALLKVEVGGKALCILIPNEQLPSRAHPGKLPDAAPVTPLSVALSNIEIRLIAELGEVEMSLGHFASLRLGDVINLPIDIDQPVNVLTTDKHLVGVAHLGQQHGKRALEMFKAPHK